MWGELQAVSAHTILLRHENEDLRHQLQTRNKPKRTAAEAAAASKVQKYGFLTNPESEAAFQEQMAEEKAKRVAEAQKAAEKEAKAKEIDGERSRLINDPTHVFNETILSYKNTTLRRLGNLAATLGIQFADLKRVEIYEKIVSHFETHPELKSTPRYSNLFRTSHGGRQAANDEPGSSSTV